MSLQDGLRAPTVRVARNVIKKEAWIYFTVSLIYKSRKPMKRSISMIIRNKASVFNVTLTILLKLPRQFFDPYGGMFCKNAQFLNKIAWDLSVLLHCRVRDSNRAVLVFSSLPVPYFTRIRCTVQDTAAVRQGKTVYT